MADPLPHDVRRVRRSGARLASVQALYQMEQTGQSAPTVIRDFMEDRLGLGPEGDPIEDADPDLFKGVVAGVVDRQGEIDPLITDRLADGWRLSRLDSISRAILRAGVYELLQETQLSAKTVIDEYVSIAHAFFEDREPGFINGVLDKIARQIRPEFGDAVE